jgi:hypothetical protein
VAPVTAKDILPAVFIPLILAEVGPWCGWLAARLLPWAARLRYGNTERAAVRLQEWSGDLGDIPGQLSKLAYAIGHLVAGTAAVTQLKADSTWRKVRGQGTGNLMSPADAVTVVEVPVGAGRRAAIVAALRAHSSERQVVLLNSLSEANAIVSALGISKEAVRTHGSLGAWSPFVAIEIPPPGPVAENR